MSLVANDYLCDEHGRFDALVDRAENPDRFPCPDCGELAPWVISAPMGRVNRIEVLRGQSDTVKTHPGMLDTQPLAEGVPYGQWKKDQLKKQAESRRKEIKAKLG